MTELLAELRSVLGAEGLLSDAAARLVYARDASHLQLGRPVAVALPRTAAEAARVIQLCAAAHVPVVCRGSGTGLSGGAVPDDGQLVLSLSRLRNLGPVDDVCAQVTAQAGVLNEQVSLHAAAADLHFAPDPSSQSISTVGGNIAENAGGPHCLRYGVTLHHVLALDWIDATGRRWRTGPPVALRRGFDLISLLCGSEGTLGVVTAADLALTRTEPDCGTLLAFFTDLAAATGSVLKLLGSSLLPVAMEIVDQPLLEAVEAAFGFGFSTTAAAALIVEFTGSVDGVAHDVQVARSLLADGGAHEIRLARDTDERRELWKCRKKAFGAVGRLAPRYVSMDVVVPVGQLPDMAADIHRIKQQHGVSVATSFHAGDGNLHPGVHYDDRDPDEHRRAHQAADDIIRAAVDRDGSATGEHGVGIEKRHVLPWQLDAVCADLQQGVALACDPGSQLNPGKALPEPGSRFAPMKPVPSDIELRRESLIVSAPAEARVADLQAQALERGLWLPVGAFRTADGGNVGLGTATTVGQLVEQLVPGPGLLAAGTVRNYLLEYWGRTGDGRGFRCGAPVFKNVAGYGLGQALCGSGRIYARCAGATFQLKPAPESVGVWRLVLPASADGEPDQYLKLWRRLQAVDQGWAPPVLVGDIGPDDQERLTVVAAGSNQPWGLDRIDRILTGAPSSAGWRCVADERLPFARAAEFLTETWLPAWALAGPTWSALSPLPVTDAGCRWPQGEARIIGQSAPRCVWLPRSVEPLSGWHLEPFCAGGVQLPTARPAADVPLELLRRLKTLFDPGNQFGGPDWLIGDELGSDLPGAAGPETNCGDVDSRPPGASS